MRGPCGIHDVDLIMSEVHNWKDVMTYFDKFGLTFFFLTLFFVLVCVGIRDHLQRRNKRRRQRAERIIFVVGTGANIREA
jgi:hypothetical protein